MFCGKCGKEAEEGVLFCGSCGWNLAGEPAAGFVSAQTARPMSEFSEFLNRKITLKMMHMLIGAAGFLVMIIIVIVLAVSNNTRPYEAAVSGRRNDREEDSDRVTNNSGRVTDNGDRVGDDTDSSSTGSANEPSWSDNDRAASVREISERVGDFGWTLDLYMDFSVYLTGGELDFGRVREEYFRGDAYSYIESIQDVFNEQFHVFGYLDSGVDLMTASYNQILNGIPVFGEAIVQMTDREIRSDPLLSRDNWSRMASVRAEASNIVVDENGDASLRLTLTFDIDATVFSGSRILAILNMRDFAERTSQTFSVDAKMRYVENGSGWMFTEFEF